jgi:simple sugar transport system permease protein
VNIRAIKVLVYTLTGFLSALAGVLVASDIKAADANNAGLYLELDGILAAVLGGTALAGGRFFLGGTLIGAALIQVMTTTILTRGVEAQYTLVVKAVIIVVVCLLQSERFRSFARARGKVAA